ncbi:MAG: hypothetical protein AAFQ53_10590, partial [Bacteroidota bacterium]
PPVMHRLLPLVLSAMLASGEPARAPTLHVHTITPAYLLIEGTLTCKQFDVVLERLVRHPHVHEFEGSRCHGGAVRMVVEFRFNSRAARTEWTRKPQTQALLQPLYRDLRDSKIQFRDWPRDPCASRDGGLCSRLSPDLRARIPASAEIEHLLPSSRLDQIAPTDSARSTTVN